MTTDEVATFARYYAESTCHTLKIDVVSEDGQWIEARIKHAMEAAVRHVTAPFQSLSEVQRKYHMSAATAMRLQADLDVALADDAGGVTPT